MLLSVVLLSLCVSVSRAQQSTTSFSTLPTSPPHVNVSSRGQHSPSNLLPVAETLLRGLSPADQLQFSSQWPSSSAAFERPLSKVDLLALKVDHTLMASLDSWLARYGITMPQSVLRTINEMELCPPRAADGMIRKSDVPFKNRIIDL